MTTAKVFENGRSQAIRLPKEFRFDDEEVFINKVGDVVMLIPKECKWKGFLKSFAMFTEDFLRDENSGIPLYLEKREEL